MLWDQGKFLRLKCCALENLDHDTLENFMIQNTDDFSYDQAVQSDGKYCLVSANPVEIEGFRFRVHICACLLELC